MSTEDDKLTIACEQIDEAKRAIDLFATRNKDLNNSISVLNLGNSYIDALRKLVIEYRETKTYDDRSEV